MILPICRLAWPCQESAWLTHFFRARLLSLDIAKSAPRCLHLNSRPSVKQALQFPTGLCSDLLEFYVEFQMVVELKIPQDSYFWLSDNIFWPTVCPFLCSPSLTNVFEQVNVYMQGKSKEERPNIEFLDPPAPPLLHSHQWGAVFCLVFQRQPMHLLMLMNIPASCLTSLCSECLTLLGLHKTVPQSRWFTPQNILV